MMATSIELKAVLESFHKPHAMMTGIVTLVACAADA